MLVDANLLLFAVDRSSPFHEAAAWLTGVLNGGRRVGIPWASLAAFVRISTHPRASEHPLSPEGAWRHVEGWLACDPVWIPAPTERHADILGGLVVSYQLRGHRLCPVPRDPVGQPAGTPLTTGDPAAGVVERAYWPCYVAPGPTGPDPPGHPPGVPRTPPVRVVRRTVGRWHREPRPVRPRGRDLGRPADPSRPARRHRAGRVGATTGHAGKALPRRPPVDHRRPVRRRPRPGGRGGAGAARTAAGRATAHGRQAPPRAARAGRRDGRRAARLGRPRRALV